MLNQVLNVSKSAFVGLGLFNSYRCSRSFAVGWKDQRLVCIIDAIGSLALLVIAAEDNLKFLGGDKLYNNVNRASYLGYIAIPALHAATKKLEHSEHKVAKKIAELSYMHMSDAVMVATAAHSFAALYYGFNKVANACLLAGVVWAYGEQGVFWDKPEEDCGPLFKYNEGNIVRTYEPVVSYLNLTVGIPFYFLYRGWSGKFTAVMACICRFAPSIFSFMIPKAAAENYRMFKDGIENNCGGKIAPKPSQPQTEWVVGRDEPVLFTQKHFDVFKVEDCFPNKTLEGLEKELQQKLSDDGDTKLEEIGFRGVKELTKRQMLEKLLGVEGNPGYLRRHVLASRRNEEKDQKTIQLKNIFGALLADWDGKKSQLIDRYEECLCRTATGGVLTDLCLEFYDDIAPKEEEKRVLLDKKIALILQQRRDRKFHEALQGFILKIKLQKAEEQRESNERSERLYEEINGWESFGLYSIDWMKQTGTELYNEFVYGAATSRHQVNGNTILMGGPMGLSFYDEAHRDVRMQLAKQLQDVSMLDKLAEVYAPIYGRYIQGLYLTGEALLPGVGAPDGGCDEELINAIVSHTDTRLDFDAIREYFLGREDQEGLYNKLYEIEVMKPTCDQGEEFDRWVQENRRYEEAKKGFLEKYMPQVLYELGYTTY